MLDTETEQDPILLEMVRRIVEIVGPDAVVLFGSRARGDAAPESDYDLLIIAPSDCPPWRRTGALYLQLGDLPVSKDLVWYTPEEAACWREVQFHFVTTALRGGRVLYERAA